MMKTVISQRPKIEVQTYQKYAHLTVDRITIDSDLNHAATKKTLKLSFRYIKKHQGCRRIFRQFFAVGPTYSSLTVLKEDVEAMLKEFVELALDKKNWVELQ